MRLGCAQEGGVVSMRDGAVTFKGGSITNSLATVRTGHDARSHAGTGCRRLRGLDIVGFAIGLARSLERLLEGR